jgi:hypothetical protein
MQFGLLGFHPDLIQLLQQIAQHPQHELFRSYLDKPASLPVAAGQTEPLQHWEALLDAPDLDAIVVAASDRLNNAQLDDQLRKFAQAGVPIIVQQPSCESLVAYEVEMIRVEHAGVLLPYTPGCFEQSLLTVAEWIADPADGQLGELQHVTMQRACTAKDAASVRRQFAADLCLLQQLIGPIKRISAVGPEHDASNWEHLDVHVINTAGVMASWTTRPTDELAGARIVVAGSRSEAVLEIGHDTAISLSLNGTPCDSESTSNAVDSLAEQLADPATHSDGWYQAARASEFAESISYCLRRGRGLDIPDERPSEHRSFKGVMSMASCGILFLVLVALGIFVVVEGIRYPAKYNEFMRKQGLATATDSPPPQDLQPFLLRIWPIYPILVFLFLQTLLVLARRHPKATSADRASPIDTS